jgi:phosphoribosylaminoimidazole (AIR) synthetase
MLKTLNCGIGMIWVVTPEHFEAQKKICKDLGYQAFDLGMVQESSAEEADWELKDPTWEGYDA